MPRKRAKPSTSNAKRASAWRRGRTLRLGRPLRLEVLEDRRMLSLTTDTLSAGVLTVDFNGADNVAITSSGGNVLVNGANPTSGAATAASVTAINITGTGNFDNTVDLSGVSAAQGFSGLATVTLAAGGAVSGDTILLGALNASGAVNVSSSGASQVTLAAGLAAGSLVITPGALSDIYLDGGVTTSGVQDYAAPAWIEANAVLSAGTGNVTFGSTLDGTHNLTVDSSGVTTFSGIVGGAAALSSLTTDAAGATVIDASMTTSGSAGLTLNDPVTLGGNATLGAGVDTVSINNTIDGPYALSISSFYEALTGAIGSKVPLASVALDVPFTSTFSGGSITTTGFQTYDTDLTLGADTTFNAGSSMILLDSGLEGGFNATFLTSGIIDFDANLGNNTALASVTTAAASSIIVNDDVTTTGNQTYNAPVTLGSFTTLNAGSGNITFESTVDGGSLTTGTTGTTTFDGAVGQNSVLRDLTIGASGTTVLAGGFISTTFGMSFGSAVELGSDMSLQPGGFAIAFDGTVDGAYNLNISGSGLGGVTFAAAVGGNTPLTSLTTSNSAISLQSVTTAGSQTYNDQAVSLDGTYASNAGEVNIENGTTLLGPTIIYAFTGVSLGTVDGAFSLDVASLGFVTLGGLIGNNTPLTTLEVNPSGPLHIDASIMTSGAQAYEEAAYLAAGAELDATGGVSFNPGGPTLTPIAPVLPAVVVNQSASTPEALSAIIGTSIASAFLTGVAITAQSTPGGTWQYSLDDTTWTNFGVVSNAASLLLDEADFVRFVPDGTHTGSATFTYRGWDEGTDSVGTLVNTTTNGTSTDFSAATDTASIAVQSAPIFVTDSFSNGELNVTVDGSQNVMIDAASGQVLVNSADPTTGALLASAVLYINVIAVGGYDNVIDLTGVSAAAGFTALSTVTMDVVGPSSDDQVELGKLNASGLVSITGSGGDAVTTSSSLVAGSVSITATTISLQSVTTTGVQTYTGAVTLAGNATLSAGSGNVTFNGTIDGDQTLTVNSSGVTTFGAAVGGNTALASLTTDAVGSTVLDASVTTDSSGSLTINDPLTLGANLTLSGGTFSLISINNTIDGDFALTTDDWDLTLAGAIGSKTALASLSLNSGSTTAFSGGSITTVGGQSYQSALTLGANATFNAGSSGILFGSTLSGAYSATVNTSGLTDFVGNVGTSNALTSLTTDAAGTTAIGGNVTTTGNQTYNEPITVGTNAMLSAGSGNITFNNTVSGGSLTAETTGTTRFNGPIGQTTALGSLTTNFEGTTVLAGGYISTTSDMSFENAVVLASDMDLVANTFSVSFSSTVDGAYHLTVGQNGSSGASFYGAVGSTTPLASLTLAGNSATLNSVATTGSQMYADGTVFLDGLYTTTTGSFNVAGSAILTSNTVVNASGAVSFNSISDPYALNIVSGGITTLGAPIGSNGDLASVTVSSAVGIYIAASVTTTGNQIYNLPVVVAQGASLTSTAGTVSQVASVPTAPVLTPIAPVLAPVPTNQAGSTAVEVSTMVGNSVTDDNGLYGIAVDAQSGPGGSWQYSLNGGTNWTNFGTVSASQSLLLAATDQIRFAPDGVDTGTATFTYLAWNETTGTAGTQVDTTTNGGTTAFSTATDTASIAVQIAPVITTNTFSAGVLTVDVDGAENVTITSSSGHVLVNGANPTTGQAASNAVTAIDITATAGAYDNVINLTGVSAAAGFTTLATVAVNTGGSYSGDQVELGVLNASGLVSITGTGTDAVTTSTATLIAGSLSITATSLSLHSVTTTGNQTYSAPITLAGTDILSAGNGNVTFNGTVNGDYSLTVNSNGVTTFGAAVGHSARLASLTTTTAGSLVLDASVSAAEITIDNSLTLEANLTLTAGTGVSTPPGDILAIKNAIDGAYALTINGREITLTGAIGSKTALASLDIDSQPIVPNTSGAIFSGGSITTTGAQTYDGYFVLAADATFNAGSAEILFQTGLEGLHNATFNTSGQTDFAGNIGTYVPVGSLTTDAAGTTTIHATVITAGNQTYNDPVTLGTSALLQANAGKITFNNAVSGGGLKTTGGGTTILAGGSVTTTGAQNYDEPVVISGNTTLTSSGTGASGAISFQSVVQGSGGVYSLDVMTPGLTDFEGDVGGPLFSQDLGNLDIESGPTQIGGGFITTLGQQTYAGAVTLAADTTLTSIGYLNAQDPSQDLSPGIDFASTVDGAFDLIADSDGVIDFAGAVGGSVPLASLTTQGNSSPAAGLTEINAAVNTSGQQTYDEPLQLQSAGSISEGLDLAAGTYTLGFLAAQGAGSSGESLHVSVDGAPAGSNITPPGSSYASYGTAAFTVTAGTHTVAIAALNLEGGDNSVRLEDVSIEAAAANPIGDPDFAAVSVGAGNWQYAPHGSPWTFTGTAGISGNSSAITVGNPTAPQGSQAAFVQFTGSMSEIVTLPAGSYTLDLLAAQRENYNHGGQTLQISVDGSLIGSITPAGSSYALYATASFTVTAGTHTITIAGTNPLGGDNTALVDDVSIQPATDQLGDPNFSAASVGSGNWQYAPNGSTWVFVGTAGVSGNDSAITFGNAVAPQGTQVAFVQFTGSMSETVSLSAGSYTLDFLAAQRENYNHGGQTLQVLVDGTPIGSGITPAGANYAAYQSATFTVAAGTHTITIAGINPLGGDNTALVEDVSIQSAAPSQLADPDFSAASVGAGNWQYAPGGSPWTFFGTAGASGNSSAITGGNPTAPQGSQVGFIQFTGSMSQLVNLPAGTYTLDFLAAQRENYNHGGQTLQVLVDGTPIGSITPAGANYALYGSAAFTVTAGPHTITIEGTNPQGGDNTAILDDVSLQPLAGNQLADPDLSAASVGAGNWQYAPAGSPWTFFGTAGVSGNSSAITGGNPVAPQGSQVAFVQMTGSMSQLVNLPAGTYTVDFLAAQRENYNHGGQTLQVLVDGTPIGSGITPAGTNYAAYQSATFTVTAGTHTITIAGTNPLGGDNTALVEEVSIQSTAPSQLADPDFSAASVGAGNWQYAPGGSPWTFFGTAGVSGNSSAITGGNPVAPQGSQVAFVQMTGSMSQLVNLPAGTYTVDFLAAQRENYNHGGQTLQVLVDGTAIGSGITPSGANYALYGSATFTVAAGTHTITIEGTNPQGGDNTAILDDVSIQPAVTGQLTDPDFSAVDVALGAWEYTPSGSPWSFLGTAGISGNASAITDGNPVAPAASQVAFVQFNGSISQAVSLSAGSYTLDFLAAQRENYNHGGQALQVLVDGTPIGSAITPSGANYANYSSISFTVGAGVHTITIQGLNPGGGDNTALVDEVMLSLA